MPYVPSSPLYRPLRQPWPRYKPIPAVPLAVASRVPTLATTIAEGNYLTRNFRQKPIVVLQTATHQRKISPKLPPKDLVKIPTVTSRRTKVYSGNKILSKIKAMPYRPKRPAFGRRSFKKRRGARRRLTQIPLAIPRTKLVRFRYVRTGTLTGTNGALATAMIKANDLNDPMGAIGTALPTSLDQWASMYQKYIVLGSKITVKFGNTTNTGPGSVGIHLHDDATALTDANHYREVGRTKLKTLTTQKDFAVIQMRYSGKKFWHLNNIKDDSEQEGTFSTTPGSPTDIAYYHVFAQDFFNSNTFVVDYMIEEEFICLLTNPINIPQSSL